MKRIGIIGMGPRGLQAFRQLVLGLIAENKTSEVKIYLFGKDKGASWIYATNLSNEYLNNVPAIQLTICSDDSVSGAFPENNPIHFIDYVGADKADEYLPRNQFGKYLEFVYEQTKKLATENGIFVEHVFSNVIDIVDEEEIELMTQDNGNYTVNHVLLTLGHSKNDPSNEVKNLKLNFSDSFITNPYKQENLHAIVPNSVVGIRGMGLTMIDVVSELTTGQGGKFVESESGLKYIKSGNEPEKIYSFSRTGLPLYSKPLLQKSEIYKPIFLTKEKTDEITTNKKKFFGSEVIEDGFKFNVDETSGLIKLTDSIFSELVREMEYRYYFSLKGKDFAEEYKLVAQGDGRVEFLLRDIRKEEIFNIVKLINPIEQKNYSIEEYQDAIIDFLSEDILSSTEGEVDNPTKAAFVQLREVRDAIRSAVDYKMIDPSSYKLLYERYNSIQSFLCVGPPIFRNKYLVALIEADILNLVPPGYKPSGDKNLELVRSDGKDVISLDYLINAIVDKKDIIRDQSILARNLLSRKIIKPLTTGDYISGGIEVSELPGYNVVSIDGKINDRISCLGILTEGSHYFTHSVPRPFVNSTSLRQMGNWAHYIVRNI